MKHNKTIVSVVFLFLVVSSVSFVSANLLFMVSLMDSNGNNVSSGDTVNNKKVILYVTIPQNLTGPLLYYVLSQKDINRDPENKHINHINLCSSCQSNTNYIKEINLDQSKNFITIHDIYGNKNLSTCNPNHYYQK